MRLIFFPFFLIFNFFALILNLLKDQSALRFFIPSFVTLRRGPRVKRIETWGINWFRMSARENDLRDSCSHPGYIMVFTLLAVGAAMVVVTYIGHRSSYYLPFSKMVLEREKAKTLALSGVQIAIAQLAQSDSANASGSAKATSDTTSDKAPNQSVERNQEQNAKKTSHEKEFLKRILPTLNRGQDFDLKEE